MAHLERAANNDDQNAGNRMLLGEFRAQGAQNVYVQTPSRDAAAPLEEKQEDELHRSVLRRSPSSSIIGAQRRVVSSPGVGLEVEQGMTGERSGSESDASAAASNGTQQTARGGVEPGTDEAKKWQRDVIMQSAHPKSSPPPSPSERNLGGEPPTWSPPPPPSRLCVRNLTSESQLAEAGQQKVGNAEICGREGSGVGDVRGKCVRKGEQILARVEGSAESGGSDSGPCLFI